MSTKTLKESIEQRLNPNQSSEPKKPGPIHSKAAMVLHTNHGHQLFFGKRTEESANGKIKTRNKMGFLTFASNLSHLWTCAINDDPYADAKLIQIEDQLKKVEEKTSEIEKVIDDLIASLTDAGVTIVSDSSIKPIEVPISCRATQAAMTAPMVGKVDRVIKKALVAKQFGLMSGNDMSKILPFTVSPMRHLFSLSLFRASGATRSDFASMNAKAHAAIEKYGELPGDILDGSRKPKLGPRSSTSNNENDASSSNDLIGESIFALKFNEIEKGTNIKKDTSTEKKITKNEEE